MLGHPTGGLRSPLSNLDTSVTELVRHRISYPNLVLLTLNSVAGAHRAGFCVRRMASLSVGGSAAFPSAASSASQKNSRRSTRPCRWKGPERGGPRAPGASPRRPHAVSGPDVSAVQADEECIPNWVDDAGLNRSLMCDDPRSLSVAKVFRTEKWDEYQSTHRYADMVSSMGSSLETRAREAQKRLRALKRAQRKLRTQKNRSFSF